MPDRPDVSIVITTFNGWSLTKRCLASLVASAGASALRAEIIISDNCSTDETPRAWEAFQNDKWPLRYRRNPENLGYLRNANAGAREARGEFLCLMNNDVVVQPGWLDAQVAFLKEHADIGLVGPKYLDARGRVAECGCAVFSDGSARQLGQGTALDDPEFAYANDVHYCSMACVVMRTGLFADLAGYDERYAPAYYEDVDLCLRIAERGLRVVVNPRVRVTHLFGGSHAAQETQRLMDRNRAVLCERWGDRLARLHPPPGTAPARLRSWPRGDTIVFHWPFLVNPDSTTGSLRNWQLLLETRRRGLHVVLVALNAPEEQPYLEILRGEGIEVHEDVIGVERLLLRRLADAHRITAAVMSFAAREERYGYRYDLLDPGIVRLFDTVDVHFLRELRADERFATWGAIRDIEFGRLPEAAYAELACMLRSDAVLLVSEPERRILVRDLHLPAEKFHVVGTIHPAADRVRPFAEREGFSFIGYGGHAPNVDAIEFIVSEVWPEIRRALPEASLHVYGFKLPPRVLALDDPAAGIAVHGFVEDHRAVLGASRVMLAPLRYGAGIKGKILEALAVGTPVVTTPMGAEGIDEDGAVLCIGTDAAELARRAVGIYRQAPQWEAAAREGTALVQRRFSPSEAGDALTQAISAGKRYREQGSIWTHVAYAAMAQQKLEDRPRDLSARIGRKVSELLYRVRGTRVPWLRSVIRYLRLKRASR